MNKLNLPAALITLIASSFGSSSAFAITETWSWNFSDNACNSTSDNTCNGHTSNSNGQTWTQKTTSGNTDHELTTQAWSTTGDVTGADQFETGMLRHYGSSGLGIVNRDTGSGSPEHAFGGSSLGKTYSSETTNDTFENMDAVLLSFEQVTTLTEVRMGWYSSDSDFSLLAWNNPNAGPGSIAGQTYDSLVDATGGWSLVGHYYHNQDSTVRSDGDLDFTVNAGGVSSSYYLLSVLNPELNAGGTGSCTTRSRACAPDNYGGNDFFKLLSLGGTTTTTPPSNTPGIPVPPTALLFLAALPLIRLTQRKAA